MCHQQEAIVVNVRERSSCFNREKTIVAPHFPYQCSRLLCTWISLCQIMETQRARHPKMSCLCLITRRESHNQAFWDDTYMLCHSCAAVGPNLCIFVEVLGVHVSGRDVRLMSPSLMPSSLWMVPVETLCPCLSLPSSSWECHTLVENK